MKQSVRDKTPLAVIPAQEMGRTCDQFCLNKVGALINNKTGVPISIIMAALFTEP